MRSSNRLGLLVHDTIRVSELAFSFQEITLSYDSCLETHICIKFGRHGPLYTLTLAREISCLL